MANGSEVINHNHSFELTLNVGLTKRLFAGLTLPTVINTRSSLYEHGRDERNTTFARGMADARIGLGYWLWDPETHPNGNLAIGLGLKIPIGNYNASDIFYNVGVDGSSEVRPVDQSIQPGDGGFGFTFDFQWYQRLGEGWFAYAGGLLFV